MAISPWTVHLAKTVTTTPSPPPLPSPRWVHPFIFAHNTRNETESLPTCVKIVFIVKLFPAVIDTDTGTRATAVDSRGGEGEAVHAGELHLRQPGGAVLQLGCVQYIALQRVVPAEPGHNQHQSRFGQTTSHSRSLSLSCALGKGRQLNSNPLRSSPCAYRSHTTHCPAFYNHQKQSSPVPRELPPLEHFAAGHDRAVMERAHIAQLRVARLHRPQNWKTRNTCSRAHQPHGRQPDAAMRPRQSRSAPY